MRRTVPPDTPPPSVPNSGIDCVFVAKGSLLMTVYKALCHWRVPVFRYCLSIMGLNSHTSVVCFQLVNTGRQKPNI